MRSTRSGSRPGSSCEAPKKLTMTSAGSGARTCSRPGGGSARRQPAGGWSRQTRCPGLSPSLRACGVPEYPAVIRPVCPWPGGAAAGRWEYAAAMSRLAEVADGVLAGTSDLYLTTTTVVAGPDRRCLVIDPSITPADLAVLAAELAARGLRPAAGWSTHPHWDHVLWSRGLGAAVVRYATPRAAHTAARDLSGLTEGVQDSAPGHDLSLFAR